MKRFCQDFWKILCPSGNQERFRPLQEKQLLSLQGKKRDTLEQDTGLWFSKGQRKCSCWLWEDKEKSCSNWLFTFKINQNKCMLTKPFTLWNVLLYGARIKDVTEWTLEFSQIFWKLHICVNPYEDKWYFLQLPKYHSFWRPRKELKIL